MLTLKTIARASLGLLTLPVGVLLALPTALVLAVLLELRGRLSGGAE